MADWRNELSGFFDREKVEEMKEQKSEFDHFVCTVAVPAFETLAEELRGHGRFVTVRSTKSTATIMVTRNGEEELTYRIQGQTMPSGVLPIAEIRFRERKGRRLLTIESMVRSGSADYKLSDITSQEIIDHFVDNYTTRVQTD